MNRTPDPAAASTPRLVAGAMSGTSADGVDVAVVRINGSGIQMRPELLGHRSHDFGKELQQEIHAVRQTGAISLASLAAIARHITEAYAKAIHAALAPLQLNPVDLAAVAAHGQTLFHDPPLTIQQFDPSLLSVRLGCTVISDFRRADLAAGGQGAPLVPFGDFILFRHPTRHRAIANIGGIANVTLLPANATPADVIAFDTGPGNCVSDFLMRQHQPAGRGFDIDGRLAASGTVHPQLLATLKADAYFARPAPKSTDGPAMVAIFQRCLRSVAGSMRLEDQLATAAQWCADVLADVILKPGETDLFVAGGGTNNAAIMGGLRRRFPSLRLTDELGVPSSAREAMAFALLGAATLDGVPSNVPSVTGADRPVVLGSITRTTVRATRVS